MKNQFKKIVKSKDETEWSAAIKTLSTKISGLRTFMFDHFDEEEKLAKVMKENFTQEEHDVTMQRVVKMGGSANATMLPWIVDGMKQWGGDGEVEKFLLALPTPIRILYKHRWSIAYEKGDRKLLRSLELQQEHPPHISKVGCTIM
eukprot:CAMPEP_0196571650 /NCGR_PEP_ID=MMETSP1081-20130531/1798_1 /TAXON_ID=36882 /ORGANISM="Pyramimonas amylifera, Strain CCMP720" /LENGTH=145 /DNA_ID=CAMNT_0041888675 /DNA_START=556 /DNA_END=993 /DNA_ORIENTATION=-